MNAWIRARYFSQQKARVVQKLKNPRLQRITFKTMRHFEATLEYHRTKDIMHVMRVLGHKNINNTVIYTHLADELFKGEQEYICRVPRSLKEACALVEAGFDPAGDHEGRNMFRKRKY